MIDAHTLGIDLGGTHVRAAVVDPAGEVRSSVRRRLVERVPEGVVEEIGLAVEEAVGAAGQGPVLGCGVGVAGQLAGASGLVRVAPNLGWRDVPFGRLLEERLRRPVTVVNDLSAAAWGEFHAGAGRGVSDLLTVFVGSGVGSAIIANARLVCGTSGVAGELGHIKVVKNGRRCGCGELGCLEAYVGGHNLIAQLRELAQTPRGEGLRAWVQGDLARLTPVVMEAAALAGDAAARELFERTAELLGMAAGNMVTMLNPARLILGGGVLSHTPNLRDRAVETLRAVVGRVSGEVLSIHDAALGDDSGIVGAALLARR